MNIIKATNQQLKNIIEWDNHCPVILLYQIYEESVKREVFKAFVISCIVKFLGSKHNAEKLTKMTMDELKWLCYEKGFEALKIYQPGNRPFIALWSIYIRRYLKDLARDMAAQKRTADIISIDKVGDWIMPAAHHNVEKTVMKRLDIEEIFSQLDETEIEIVIKRYEGYTMKEIGLMQGVTHSGIQRRIKSYLQRIKGA